MRDDYEQFAALELSASVVERGDVTVQYMGNTNLLISDGRSAIMLDAWFSRPTAMQVLAGEIEPDMQAISHALQRSELRQLDVIIPVHSHFDHAMDAPEVAKRTGAVLLGSESTANIARGWGLDEAQI
ncbi:MBL fold metallo-hydrolase [Arenicella xantha]|uniref:Metallo-beta-lactamase superfamily protein n=1 Tax=Arenicella xantha TaxID=644221 RepID=A0A395JNY3_9GAMM|nr:MBL fold metallo-hydrolase [Arenicella xantha]RBP51274.1 metallo-beta-lactamase superfamily protein [Arenicella xantha]